MDIRKLLEEAFNSLCLIPVSDINVERMATAKQLLKLAYSELEKTETEADGS